MLKGVKNVVAWVSEWKLFNCERACLRCSIFIHTMLLNILWLRCVIWKRAHLIKNVNWTLVSVFPPTPNVASFPRLGAPCPDDIIMDLPFNQRTALVSWSVPNPGPGFQRIAGPSFSQRFYPVGTNTTIRYIFNNGTDDYKCTFTIIVGKYSKWKKCNT